jgi:hypothetical protein
MFDYILSTLESRVLIKPSPEADPPDAPVEGVETNA